MPSVGLPPWGNHTLTLTLPGLTVTVSGLSDSQFTALRADHAPFVHRGDARPAQGVELYAVRDDDFRPPDAAQLTRDGQYAPQKSGRSPDGGFDLNGINFSARLHPAGGPPGFIAVAEQGHLAQANVFENVLRVLCAYSALRQGGAVLHSAGIVSEGSAWVFCGRSNAGKTTLATKAHAAGLGILSDDINLLLPSGNGFHAHAVPFTGEFGRTLERTESGAFPVAGLVLLQQGEGPCVQPVSAASATAALLAGCPFVNDDEHETDHLLDTVGSLASRVPVMQLTSALGDDIGAIMAAIERELFERTTHHQVQAQ